MNFDQVMWGNKKFSDLLKDIYTNSKEKEKQIKELIETLKPLINNSQSALLIVPLIAEHLNISVKNDEQLIKLASIVQRALLSSSSDEAAGFILSEAEKEQLYSAVQSVSNAVKSLPEPVAELPEAKKELPEIVKLSKVR
jgi:hypothetical protein